jgi:hypothetical protein
VRLLRSGRGEEGIVRRRTVLKEDAFVPGPERGIAIFSNNKKIKLAKSYFLLGNRIIKTNNLYFYIND